ncbi:DNA cytosine methyltransferase [Hymenobacter convexus]|uniref:DNA cytosine methyltransferase n=1 Tax=Hymenobacter sp. CA1UV-4 TaxID=3063782 RepID=UPI00272B54F0|nr:DNA cytosine methyltransferase [Hymenobacter sp. CA1UV-4]
MQVEQKGLFKYSGIDIFSGAGGMSCGAMAAGVSIDLAVEFDKHSANTFKKNHPNTLVIQDDISNINPKKYITTPPFVVFGGPPCQGFSKSNTKTRDIGNDNNNLFREFIRFVDELQPQWFVFENVEGFQSFNKGKTLKSLELTFKGLKYTTSHKVLCASSFGVPQRRKRFFMVGNRDGIKFEFPKETSTEITVKDAFHDLPKLINGQQDSALPYISKPQSQYAKLMRGATKESTQNLVSRNRDYVVERYAHIPQGGNWRSIPNHMLDNYANLDNCHGSIYRRLNLDEPSVIISNYRKNMLIHPEQDRGLSVREAARLQSFPDSYVFEGNLVSIQQQIGNAVPPLLAKEIFSQLISASK